MAIYEYYCPSCRKKFEERRPMSQAAVATKCECGNPADRMISSFAMSKGDTESMFSMAEGEGGGGCCGGGACGCSN
jgi:putative FmdB family regulatory protein